MDSARFRALGTLIRSAQQYMGKTWRNAVNENMEGLENEYRELSLNATRNLEAVVSAEQREKGLNAKIEELGFALTEKSKGETIIVETKVEEIYNPATDEVDEVATETVVTVIPPIDTPPTQTE